MRSEGQRARDSRPGAARRETSRLRLLPSLVVLALLPAPCGPGAGFLPLAGNSGPGSPTEVLGESVTAPPDGGPGSPPGPPPGPPDGTTRPGGATDGPGGVETRVAPRDFRLSGTISAPLVPGARRALDVVIENLDPYPLEVTAISVAFGGPILGPGGRPNTACRVDGPSPDLVVEREFIGPVLVPPNRAVSLSALAVPEERWPVLAMVDRPVNQDACRNSLFPIVFTGTGRVE